MESSKANTAAIVLYMIFMLYISPPPKVTALTGIDAENQLVVVTPSPLLEPVPSRDALLCDRVHVSGLSRLKLWSYSNAHRISVVPSDEIPKKFYKKIQICFHKNSSLGLCQCEKDDWKSIETGTWSSVISPYDDRYIDVKYIDNFSGSLTVSLNSEFQKWRMLCLVLGFVLLLLAPIISSWAPFYYSSSMVVGVCLVILILLFQGMKLLPTGRKSTFYATIYACVFGAGSFVLHQFSVFVNSILVNFGLSEEMHNPVAVFVLVGIVLAGAGFGYWLVRKFVVLKDGSVDVGIAQFVKWAIRIVAMTFIFQSTLDIPLAMALLGSLAAISYYLTSKLQSRRKEVAYSTNHNAWMNSNGRVNKPHRRAEFLSRSGQMSSRVASWNSPKSASAWSDSPVKGVVSPSSRRATRSQQDYFSSFHKTPNRKKFTKQEWEVFTEESTRQAMAEWASSPEFTDWMMKNADRIKLEPEDSSDESVGSGSDSTDEKIAESSSGLGLLRWHHRK